MDEGRRWHIITLLHDRRENPMLDHLVIVAVDEDDEYEASTTKMSKPDELQDDAPKFDFTAIPLCGIDDAWTWILGWCSPIGVEVVPCRLEARTLAAKLSSSWANSCRSTPKVCQATMHPKITLKRSSPSSSPRLP